MALRKALVQSSSIQDNAASFVNVTAERLHIRMLHLFNTPEGTAAVVGDAQIASVDEVPVLQAQVNDSRSHIMSISPVAIGGTGTIVASSEHLILPFNRNDLVLDPDEALFLNIKDIVGNLDQGIGLNVWYED